MAVLASRCVLCCLLFSAAAVWAESSPKYVYLVSNHKPSDVFYNGFQALGSNEDLHMHASGVSCAGNDGDTAFIDTTTNKNFAFDWGVKLYPSGPFYMYKIRATDQFYELKNSLEKTAEKMKKEDDCRFELYSYDSQQLPASQGRWIARTGISNRLIYRVCEFQLVKGMPGEEEWKQVRREYNPKKYTTFSTRGNPVAFIYDPDHPHAIQQMPVDNTIQQMPVDNSVRQMPEDLVKVAGCLPSAFYITGAPTPTCSALDAPAQWKQPNHPLTVPGEAKNQKAKKSIARLMRLSKNVFQRVF